MNFENLGDKIIDDQGNVKTIAGGADARLYYLDYAGNRKKYLLEGEVEIEGQKRKSIEYFDFESNTFLSVSETLTSINFNLPEGTLENAILQFTTGDTIEFAITGSASYKINKPFAFEPNKTYLIYVDVYNVFWCELQNFNQ
jgi:hypothetical protein